MEREHKKSYICGLLLGLALGIVLVLGVFVGIRVYRFAHLKMVQNSSEDGTSVVNANSVAKMETIQAVIDEFFYGDEVTTQQLQDGIYKGMAEALNDPYSEYYTKEELEEVLNENEGISYGIGAYISMDQTTDMPVISEVMEDSPAQNVGLRGGDIIYKVDGTSTQGMGTSKVVSMVKGLEGTTVHLTIYRQGEYDYLEFDVKREKRIENTTVDCGILDETDTIGYIRIREFDEITVDQYTEAMAELKEKGINALILDLRSNPGGDLNAVVEIARKILPEGMIVYTEDKAGNRKEYTCDGKNELTIPLVVLTNEYSASASEILAGAIQDYNKGTLVGTTTYGKGIVQRIQYLGDGSALKLTVSAYFTPSGRNIHGIGIEPDIEVEMDYEQYAEKGIDNQLEKAIEILEGKIN